VTDNGHLQGWKGRRDPLEGAVEQLLDHLGEPYDRDHPSRLDFYLPRRDLFIECKRFATPRIADQLARVDGQDVVVIMGGGALAKLCALLDG
jgi:hypothetical protein